MADQLILPRATDANDDPISGAKAYVYQTGTTTPVPVYTDTGLTTPHAQPIVADSEGRFAQAFYGGSVQLKVVFTDASDVELETRDPAQKTLITGSAASSTSFTATTAVPVTNVEDAINRVQTNLEALKTLEVIAVKDISAAAATVDFTEFDETQFEFYKFVFGVVRPTADGKLKMRTSTDGGTTFDSGSSDYNTNFIDLISGASAVTSTGAEADIFIGDDLESTSLGFNGHLDLYMPHLAFHTYAQFQGSYVNDLGNFEAIIGGGRRIENAAVNAVSFRISGSTFASGRIAMYGGRKA